MGEIYDGEVRSIMDYGAFIELLDVYPRQDGLCHISCIAHERIRHPSDVLQVNQRVKVKVTQIKGTKIGLSMKDVDQQTGEDLSTIATSSTFSPVRSAGGNRSPPRRRRRMNSMDLFDLQQQLASGVLTPEEQKRLMEEFEQEEGDLTELQPEEAVDIEVQEKIAPFLTGFVTNKEAMEPTKIIKNPEGTLNRAAIAGQEMMKERKLLRERQMREEREKLHDVFISAVCFLVGFLVFVRGSDARRWNSFALLGGPLAQSQRTLFYLHTEYFLSTEDQNDPSQLAIDSRAAQTTSCLRDARRSDQSNPRKQHSNHCGRNRKRKNHTTNAVHRRSGH